VIVALALVAAANHAQRGTGVASGVSTKPGLSPVFLGQNSANTYNPFGTGPENRNEIGNVVDGDPNTTWTTEQYYDGNLKKPAGVGAGVYLDASPGVVARALEIQTPTPGFAAQVYVANHIELALPYGSPMPLSARGWQGPVGQSSYVHDRERIQLNPGGGRFRYYLLWITTLPPNTESAGITDLTLFK
jgi:hypothetical protein